LMAEEARFLVHNADSELVDSKDESTMGWIVHVY